MIKFKVKEVLFAVFVILMCSPARSQVLDKPCAKRIKVRNINENVNISLESLTSKIVYIKLETTSNNLIGNISKVLILDDKLVVHDVSTGVAHLFSMDGKYIKPLNRLGMGPRQTSKVTFLAQDPYRKRLLLFDNNRNRLFEYCYDGELIEQQRITGGYGVSDIMPIDEKFIALSTYESNTGDLKVFSRDLKKENFSDISLWEVEAEQNFFFSKYNNSLRYFPSLQHKVFEVNPDYLTCMYEIDFGPLSLPDNLQGMPSRAFSSTIHSNSSRNVVTHLRRFGEDDHTISFSFWHVPLQKSFTTIRSKKTDKTIYLNKLKVGSGYGWAFALFRWTDDGQRVGTISAIDLTSDLTKRGSKEWGRFANANELIGNTISTDNPVIVIYKLKADL